MDSSQFFGISSIAYILAMVAYIAYLVFRNSTVGIFFFFKQKTAYEIS